MNVTRAMNIETDTFLLGDIIRFELIDGEPVEAMAVKFTDNGTLFVTVDCLQKEYRMNPTNTNEGGYEKSELRDKLNHEIVLNFPKEIRDRLVPFENGDFLRLPTEKEIFGENPYGNEKEAESVTQWKPMVDRRNRIAYQGSKTGTWEWYWLQNEVEAASFALVNTRGFAYFNYASDSYGVRPVFLLI